MRYSKTSGFTLMELMIVFMVLGIVLGLAGSFSPIFSSRRNVDQLTSNVSGDIQLVKLQAAREGVEHRVIFELSADETVLEITNERGNSNTASTTWTQISNRKLLVENEIDVDFIPSEPLEFKPTGEASTDSSFLIKPVAGARYNTCGQVLVTKLGHIGIIKGNWDGTNCNQIKDKN